MGSCSSCGAINPSAATFCNACGARLHASTRERPERSGERRIVTMLFCDVRGSTSIAEDLDPEEWTDVMNDAFEQLIAPVYRYEGTVARLMGDAVLAFFGAPTAHEDDPQRAVMAGLDIVAGIVPFRERLKRERGLDLNVRVGINTGPVVVGDVGSALRQEYSAMGDAVNVAARMEQTAEPGTVQITDATYRLVADLFDVEPLGEMQVKGKRLPLRTYRVLGRLPSPWTIRAARALDTPIVGRTNELADIRSALDAADDGRGSVVLIVGEPGIGKSRLIDEATTIWKRRHKDEEPEWEVWRFVPYDSMQPYAQYRRLILERGAIAETDPPDVVREKIADSTRELPGGVRERNERVARALLGVELQGETRLEGEAFQREAIDVVLASTRPVRGPRLLVFEDLHWSDHASLELVREIARLVETEPLVLLISFRGDRQAISWEFKRWIQNELPHRSRSLELQPLARTESDQLVRELLPAPDMPGDVRGGILEKTEGNPLFIHEVARTLIQTGLVEPNSEGGWRVAGDLREVAIPDTVQSLITVALDRLPERARRTLQTAAVIGRDFDEDVLLAVAGEGSDDVEADLRTLQRQGLIHRAALVPRPTYAFRHALTQEVAYGSLLRKRRREVHRRIARMFESSGADRLDEMAPILARHFGEAGDDDATLKYASAGGHAAARLHANAEAERHYRAALDAAHRLGAEADVLSSLYERRGTALELSGRYDEASENYEEMREVARRVGDESMALAANASFAVLYSTATPLFDPEIGRRMSEENAETARRLGDRAAEARSLWNILLATIYGGGDTSQAIEAGEASLAIARDLGDRDQIAFTLNDLSRAHMAAGAFDAAARRLEESRRLWEELGIIPMLCENLTVTSLLELLEGELEEARSHAEAALSMAGSIDNAWGQSFALMSVYRIELEQGRIGAAMDSMRRSQELGEAGGFTYAAIAPRADLARTLAYLGDGERALVLADRALEVATERLPAARAVALLARTDALIVLGDHAGARDAIQGLAVALPEPDRTFVHAGLELARARLALAAGDPEAARSVATEVADALRSSGARVLLSEALTQLAIAELGADRLDEAEDHLTEAIEQCERMGQERSLLTAVALMARVCDRRGTAEESADLRRRAEHVADGIAAGIGDEDLRRRFRAGAGGVALR